MGGSSGGFTQSAAPYGRNHDGTPSTKAERDAWNRQRAKTGLGGVALKRHLDNQAQQRQVAQMFSMFEGFGEESGGGGFHEPSGPSAEEIAAKELEEKNTKGISDLNKAYDAYLTASDEATSLANTKIAGLRSTAALQGLDFNLTDERKSELISEEFASLFTATQMRDLETLNTDYGQLRLDSDDSLSALEFLISRGAATNTGDDDSSSATAGKPGFGSPTGSADIASLLDNQEDEPTTNLLGV